MIATLIQGGDEHPFCVDYDFEETGSPLVGGRTQIFCAVFGGEKSPSRKHRVSPPAPPLQRKYVTPNVYRVKISSNDPGPQLNI
jgi:hypothetical protein